jgi:hypothetical protein
MTNYERQNISDYASSQGFVFDEDSNQALGELWTA